MNEQTSRMTRLLLATMIPSFAVISTMAMFAVAVPQIRADFGLTEDVAAWLVVAYTLPFMALMPLYGRFGDLIGRRGVLAAGLLLFAAGSAMLLVPSDLSFVLLARAVQGAGAAGVNPLAMSLIIEHTPGVRRGTALGTWNSAGPISGMVGPIIAGPIIDAVGWRAIMVPSVVATVVAAFLVARLIPSDRPRPPGARRAAVMTFDWAGVILFNVAVGLLVFYTSSRPVTGVDPLTDWRLALGAGAVGAGFLWWQSRARRPFFDLTVFRNRNFSFASICVSIRMMLLGGVNLLVPLFLTDLFDFPAAATGAVISLHAVGLLVTMRIGGHVIDRYRSRLQIIAGLLIESLAMLLLVLMPLEPSLGLTLAAVALHGMGAGLCLAALHLFALGTVSKERSATAAGLYSMVRFAGSLFGAAIGGVVLYVGIAEHGATVPGYTPAFLLYLAISIAGAAAALGLTRRLPG